MSFTSSFLFSMLLSTNSAVAEIEDPIQRGFVVGGVTALSTVVGTVAGANIFKQNWLRGALLGATIMAPIGAMIISQHVGANQWIVGGSTAATSIVGCVLTMTSQSDSVLDTGLVMVFLMPTFGAGISAGLAPQPNQYSVSPVITSQYRGVVFQTTF